MINISIGDVVYDLLGHKYRVIEVQSDYRFRVQAMTPDHREYGAPFVIGRSDLRISFVNQ